MSLKHRSGRPWCSKTSSGFGALPSLNFPWKSPLLSCGAAVVRGRNLRSAQMFSNPRVWPSLRIIPCGFPPRLWFWPSTARSNQDQSVWIRGWNTQKREKNFISHVIYNIWCVNAGHIHRNSACKPLGSPKMHPKLMKVMIRSDNCITICSNSMNQCVSACTQSWLSSMLNQQQKPWDNFNMFISYKAVFAQVTHPPLPELLKLNDAWMWFVDAILLLNEPCLLSAKVNKKNHCLKMCCIRAHIWASAFSIFRRRRRWSSEVCGHGWLLMSI